MQLAMEIPTSFLKEWSPLADLDFVLAHQVLEDSAYAEFFFKRPQGREVLLDNSLHELGHPLPVSDLLEAAIRCRADYVISPDRVGDIAFNTEQYKIARAGLVGFKIAVVMTGSHDGPADERERFLFDVRDAEMLCCTFKESRRLSWYTHSAMAHRWMRVHLLGLAELSELQGWVTLSKNDARHWSIDTGKCLKWGMEEKYIDEIKSLRKAPLHSKKLLTLREEDISSKQEYIFRKNVEILRSYL